MFLLRNDPVGRDAPDITAEDLTGNDFRLKDHRGQVVLVNFWATWCQPCTKEIPYLLESYPRLKGNGIVVIGISLDDNKSRLRQFIKKNTIPWRNLFSGKAWRDPIIRNWGVRGIPSIFLIGYDGRVLATNIRGPEKGVRLILRDKLLVK